MSTIQIVLTIDSNRTWTPSSAEELLDRIPIPASLKLASAWIEPASELDRVAELIEHFSMDELDQAEARLSEIESMWGMTPGSVRLSTRIDRIRILGK